MTLFGSLSSLFTHKPPLKERFEILRCNSSDLYWKSYVARDRKSYQMVDLKVFNSPPKGRDPGRSYRSRPGHEGRIGMAVRHPNIVTTLEHGTSGDGQPYVALESLEGHTLNGLLMMKRRELDGRRLELIRQAAAAISHFHRKGFVHRDICPRNFIVSRDFRSLKLTNLGISVPATRRYLKEIGCVGSRDYAAPEVIGRRPRDERLDVFSFGILAYEICTFQLPWGRGVSPVRREGATAVDIRLYRPQINAQLAEAIVGCLCVDREERTPSMEHFLKQIADVHHEDSLTQWTAGPPHGHGKNSCR